MARWYDGFGFSWWERVKLYEGATVLIPAIKAFFWDETAFIRYSRAAIYGLSVAITQGLIPGLSTSKYGWWVAMFLPVLALMLGAGERNPRPDAKPSGS